MISRFERELRGIANFNRMTFEPAEGGHPWRDALRGAAKRWCK
jgi:hypothetical protein